MTGPESKYAGNRCDECHREGVKIERVHRGERFCEICYARMFKRRLCPSCGNFARLPILEQDAICLNCETARPCVRCGRTTYRTGLRTPYGPACIPCARYFAAEEPCEACGTLSRWLSRSQKAAMGNDLRLCPRCLRAHHGTCEACRRYRSLVPSIDGRNLCRACAEQGEIPCPACGEQMPAGCGKHCWDCYWRHLVERRIAFSSAGLASPTLAQRFTDFGTWLVKEIGAHKAAMKISRNLDFFQEIENKWDDIPQYTGLLQHFGAAGLRRYPSAMRWMEAAGVVVVDAEAREADSERRRIDAIIESVRSSSEAADILSGYHATLRTRTTSRKGSLRSVRLALSPAGKLLERAARERTLPPDQRVLDAILREAPGQHAALSGFVTYLRREHGAELALPRRSTLQRQRARRAKLLPDLLAMMHEADRTETVDRRWVRIALQYFHDITAKAGRNAADHDITADADGITVTVKRKCYWIPWPHGAGAASTIPPEPSATNRLQSNSARESGLEPSTP